MELLFRVVLVFRQVRLAEQVLALVNVNGAAACNVARRQVEAVHSVLANIPQPDLTCAAYH